MGAYQFTMKEYIMFDSVDELVTVIQKTRRMALKEIIASLCEEGFPKDPREADAKRAIKLFSNLGKYNPSEKEITDIMAENQKAPSQ